MPEAIVDGAKFHYEDLGDGFPVVFTHGLGGDMSMWVFQLPAFRERYRVITWDVRGHGRSEITEEGYSIGRFVEDLAGLLRSLGIDRAHLVGLSMGGWISWEFALAYPEMVERLVLSNSAGLMSARSEAEAAEKARLFELSAQVTYKNGRKPIVQATIDLMFSRGFIEKRADLIDVVKKTIEMDPGVGYARTIERVFLPFMRGPLDKNRDRVKGVKTPTLIISGDEDLLTPPYTQEALHELIAGSRLETMESAGHLTPMEQPGTWNRMVMNFLSEGKKG